MSDPALTNEIKNAIAKRRTFAIISHPDAGKTTLTEKLLLYSGMIQTAGMVRGRKGGKVAVSDWMGMEQERGISITASAMQFPYKNAIINVLDTPGHQDFSEDTYRTLTAADCAIMVIDAAKGVETQTRKLFEVCRLRGIPVMTFINKMDLPGPGPPGPHAGSRAGPGHPFLRHQLARGKRPRIRRGRRTGHPGTASFHQDLRGRRRQGRRGKDLSGRSGRKNHVCRRNFGEKLHHDLELLEVAGNPYDRSEFLKGKVTPVFFASALTNFGVEPFFDAFVEMAPPPRPPPGRHPQWGDHRGPGRNALFRLCVQTAGQHEPQAPGFDRLPARLLGPL